MHAARLYNLDPLITSDNFLLLLQAQYSELQIEPIPRDILQLQGRLDWTRGWVVAFVSDLLTITTGQVK